MKNDYNAPEQKLTSLNSLRLQKYSMYYNTRPRKAATPSPFDFSAWKNNLKFITTVIAAVK